MPDNAEVFEELQQAARLCLDSPAAGSQVCACLVMIVAECAEVAAIT